jgi:hypothetical protein
METAPRTDFFHGLFEWWPQNHGRPRLRSNAAAPRSIPDPSTGLPLAVATVELSERGVCPSCTEPGAGGYVSFVADLRLAFACPSCRKLVWLAGA